MVKTSTEKCKADRMKNKEMLRNKEAEQKRRYRDKIK